MSSIVSNSDFEEIIPRVKLKKARIGFISSPFIGSLFAGDIKTYTDYLHQTGTNMVLSLGNLFYIDTKRHSQKKNERAQLLEELILIDPSRLDKKLESAEIEEQIGEYSFVDAEKQFDGIIKKLNSEFSGLDLFSEKTPFYGVLGQSEYDMISHMTNSEIRNETASTRAKIDAARRGIKREIMDLQEEYEELTIERSQLDKMFEDPETSMNSEEFKAEAERIKSRKISISKRIHPKRSVLEKTFKELSILKKKTIMTNFSIDRRKEIWAKNQDYVIESLQESIPSLKILSPSVGRIHLSVGGRDLPIQFSYDFSKNYTSKGMSTLLNSANSALRSHERPSLMIQGGVYPYFVARSIRADVSSPSKFTGSKIFPPRNGGHRYIQLRQINPLINVTRLEKILEGFPKTPDKKISSLLGGFNGGIVLGIDKVSRDELLPPEYLTNLSAGKAGTNPKMLKGLKLGDQHFGDPFISMPQTGHKPYIEHFYENWARIKKDLKLGKVAFVEELGDIVTAGNFPLGQEVNPLYVKPYKLPSYVKGLKKQGLSAEEINVHLLRNAWLTPTTDIRDQMEIHRTFTGNYSFYQSFLEDARSEGLIGPAVVINSGNHEKNTTLKRGIPLDIDEVIADRIKSTLLYGPGETEPRYPEHSILYHRFGQESISHLERRVGEDGTVLDSYSRHKQISSHRRDSVTGFINAVQSRGCTSILGIQGHTHVGQFFASKDFFGLTTKPWQGRNAYGEDKNFSIPSIGCDVLMVPTQGFGQGPMIRVDIDSEYLERDII